MKKGTIGIVIACHNYGRFLEGAVSSVLKQSRKTKQIVISDDASNDETKKIATKYCKKYPRIISYIRNSKRQGTVSTYNRGVDAIDTDYLCILDADDILHKDYLKKTAAILDNKQNVAVVYTDFVLFGPRSEHVYLESDEPHKYIGKNNSYIIGFRNFNESARQELFKKNFIHNSSLIRTNVFHDVGGYKKSKAHQVDHDLFVRMLDSRWDAYHVPLPLLQYRHHSIRQTSSRFYLNEKYKNEHLVSLSKQKLIEDYILLEKKILSQLKVINKITGAKFYKLWQFYCSLRERIIHHK